MTVATLPQLGVTHWSSRLLGVECGISFATVARIWRTWNVQPWRVETFTFSTDPKLEAEFRDVVGLYLNPPRNAVVVSIDQKSQIQARPWTALPRSCRCVPESGPADQPFTWVKTSDEIIEKINRKRTNATRYQLA